MTVATQSPGSGKDFFGRSQRGVCIAVIGCEKGKSSDDQSSPGIASRSLEKARRPL